MRKVGGKIYRQSIDGEGSNQEAVIPSTNKDSYPTYAQKRYALKRKLSVGGSNELLGFLKSSQKNEKQEQALIDVLKQEFLDATQDTKDYAVMCSSESKNKNKSFSIEETLNLLTIYQQPEMRSKFSKNKKSRMIAWRAVSRIMTELGFPRTPQQCMYRFSNLRKKYNNIKKALQAGEPKPKWPYWEEFEAIYEPRESGVAVYLDDAMLQPEDMSASSPQASTLTPTHELGGDGDEINQAQGLTLGCDVKNVHQPTTAFPQTNNQSTNKRTLEETVSELLDFLKESRKREEEAQTRTEARNQELLEAVQNISHCIKVIADGLQGMKNTPMDYHVVK
uniref:Myb/SANT-like DNA-binding domain-containing protein n=1 Tax=Timema douglasi TaxID=61478 RepID=A0A7R8VD58_TIMDO|nr:unnamed protein product [Timema douglasi]